MPPLPWGQGSQGIGDAQPYRDGESRVDGGGAHHIQIIPGGPYGQAQPGLQKEYQKDACQNGKDTCQK